MLKHLEWARGLEEHKTDGTAQVVDVTNVKAEGDLKDVDSTDWSHDAAKTEIDPDATVKADTTKDTSSNEELDIPLEVVPQPAMASAVTIDASGENPETGGYKRFELSGFDATGNPALQTGDNPTSCVILMQNGVLPEAGLNGVTAEDLIAVVQELYRGYQAGQFACEENEKVLFHMNAARVAIQSRLNRRAAQGTEGTYQGN